MQISSLLWHLLLLLPFIQSSLGQITVVIDGDWRHQPEYLHWLGHQPSVAQRFQLNLHKNIGTPQHKMLLGQSKPYDVVDLFTFSHIPKDWVSNAAPENTHDRKRKQPVHDGNIIDLEIVLASTNLYIWRKFRIVNAEHTSRTVYRASILPTNSQVHWESIDDALATQNPQIKEIPLGVQTFKQIAPRIVENTKKLMAIQHQKDKDNDHYVQRVLLSLECVDLRETLFLLRAESEAKWLASAESDAKSLAKISPELMGRKKIEFAREREALLNGQLKVEQQAGQKRQRVSNPMSMGGGFSVIESSVSAAAGNQASQRRPSQVMENAAENPPQRQTKVASVFIPHHQQQQQNDQQQLENYFATVGQMVDASQLRTALTNAMPKNVRSSVQNPMESQKPMGQNSSMFSILESQQGGNYQAQDGSSSAAASGSKNKGKKAMSMAKFSLDPNWLGLKPSGEASVQENQQPPSGGANEAEDAADIDLTLSLANKKTHSE